MLDARAIDKDDAAAVARAASDPFWAEFDKEPFESLEFLENRIASQAADADLLFLNYVGTDFQAFQKSFDRMKIVEGTTVPPGKRGFLFAKHVYEEQLKLKAARRLDQIKEGVDSQGETIAKTPDLHAHGARERLAGARDPAPARRGEDGRLPRQAAARARQQGDRRRQAAGRVLPDRRQNFHERYDFFYRELAPSLELYRVRIGDVLTIKAFTRSGYVQSVNVPVYGTFQFQGLEKSTLAGALNLMDLVSFRELYGFMSGEKLAEIQALQKAAGAHDVSRENAEAELFGSKPGGRRADEGRRAARSRRRPRPASRPAMRDLGESLGGKLQREEARSRVFPPGEVETRRGAERRGHPQRPQEDPARPSRRSRPRARKDGLSLKAIDWQKAAGIIGQFIDVARQRALHRDPDHLHRSRWSSSTTRW